MIVGRTADYVLKDNPNVVRVFIHAPKEYRIGRVMKVYGDTREEAEQNIARSDKARAMYYKNISGLEWGDEKHYKLVIDSSVGIKESVEMVLKMIN